MFGPPPRFNGRTRTEKPKSLRQYPAYICKQIGGFFARYAYIFKLVWETNPLILFAMAFSSIFNGVTPVLGAFISAQLINALVTVFQGQSANIEFWIILQFAYFLIQGVVSTVYNAIIKILSEKVVNHIKVKIITKSKEIDLAQFDLPEFYEKFENACREASFRPVQILSSTFTMLSNLISAISFIAVLAAFSPFAPIAIILLALPAAIIRFIYGRKNFLYMRRHSKDRRLMEYYSAVVTNKDLVKEVRLFNLSNIFVDKFQTTFDRYYKGLKRLTVRETLWHLLITLVTAFVNAILFLAIAKEVGAGSGDLTVGHFSLYSGALNSIIGCVGAIVSSTATIYEGTLFIDNMIAFNKVKPQIVPILDEPRAVEKRVSHTIEFKNVYFSYPGIKKYVLKNISFKLEGGDTAVLVGLNGAGKTTLIKLLTRLYDPTEGVILLDGKDIREYDLNELYSLYGIIFQDFGKYAVQVKENICFGDVSKQDFEADMLSSAKQSGAEEFIKDLPKGYETYLSKFFEEDGAELSIGQWQKLAVARAFYADSDILILDEPTASLDALAEQQIFNQFDSLRKDKTTIFVSHRLSSATRANIIIVLEQGEIVEMGNHAELMALGGKYYELFSAQAERYISYSDNENE